MDKYPTTVSELTAMMEEGWPEVRLSVKACEQFVSLAPDRDDNPRDKALVFLGPENPGVIRIAHMTYINGVPKEEGLPPARNEKFFSEEQAVRATWAEFCAHTPAKHFNENLEPVCLIWRLRPVCDVRPGGIYYTRSRYSCVWRSVDTGELVISPSHPGFAHTLTNSQFEGL